jgi:uncharacterized protein YkwD
MRVAAYVAVMLCFVWAVGVVTGCSGTIPLPPFDGGSNGGDNGGDGGGNGGDANLSNLEALCTQYVNDQRVANGLAALPVDADVTGVARGHSTDMATRNYFEHETPEGLSPGDRAQQAGISYTMYGENIAWTSARAGRSDEELADAIVRGWMNSPGHRANILRAEWQAAGLGIAESVNGIYFTQNFIRR